MALLSHTSHEFEAELRQLKGRLLAMGGRCEQMIIWAVSALEEQNVQLAEDVMRADRQMTEDEMAVDEMAMRMLALSSNEFPLIAPAQLAALPMPVLLMRGQNTPAIHAETFANVCAAMPQARRETIEGAGHGTSGDNPARFNALVLDFLQAHAAR